MTEPSALSLTHSNHVLIVARSHATHPNISQPALETLSKEPPSTKSLLRSTRTLTPREPTMPSLLDLPPELRATVFDLALAYETPIAISGIYPAYHGEAATTTLTRTHLAPTQISRQLRLEALPILYRANTFAICLQPVCVRYIGERVGNRVEIFRRSYGDEVAALWLSTLAEEGLRGIGRLRVYVACVTRWDPDGDEGIMEREKFRAYRVGGEMGTTRMTEHMLYDMCSGSRLF